MSNEKKDAMDLVGAPAPDDFWDDAYGYSGAERERMMRLYEGTMRQLNENEIVKGRVMSVDDREVVVNIGYKSEGVISASEFRDLPQVKPGDEVEVYLEQLENRAGQMVLSRKKASSVRTWEKINRAVDEEIILEGIVRRRTKGGFVVDLEGVESFLPGSQIDVKPVRDYDSYVGKRMEFKVVKINHQQNNVVVSHKALIEKDLEVQKAEIINNLERGQILEGVAKNITPFGVFIDLGGVDGLLHITDISWGRISSPEEVLKVDQKINVVVLDFDDEKKRISLGLKQLQPHPWDSLGDEVAVGNKVRGKVVTIAEYGVFIEIQPGVEGLIHVSEMSWSQHPKNPAELFKVGDEVEAVILTLDQAERKMSLGIKQLTEDPWSHVAEKYPVGSKHSGVVRNITSYGLFVELEEGIDGMILIQDLSWTKKINHPSEFIAKDEKLDVVVLDLDVENRRLRLGHKQLTDDPWDAYETLFPVDSVHEGTLTRMVEKGASIELPYGIEGFCPVKALKVEAGKEELKEGDTAKFKIIEFNKENRRIVLSHSRVWQDELDKEKKAKKKSAESEPAESFDPTQQAEPDKGTLGELAALAGLKAAMEAQAPATETSVVEAVAETPVVEAVAETQNAE